MKQKFFIEIDSIHNNNDESIAKALEILSTEIESRGIESLCEEGQGHYLGGIFITVTKGNVS